MQGIAFEACTYGAGSFSNLVFYLFYFLALLKLPVDFRSNQHSGKINNEL
jgi:hypothetical protein